MTRLRKIIFVLLDTLFLAFSLQAAIWLRFGHPNIENLGHYLRFLPVAIPTALCIFWMFGLYNRSLRYISFPDMVAISSAVTVSSLFKSAILYFSQDPEFTSSTLILDWMMVLLLVGTSRTIPRLLLIFAEFEPIRTLVYGEAKFFPKRVLIYGAGRGGESVAREIRRNENLPYEIVGFLDDMPKMWGQIIHGVPVLGSRKDLHQIVIDKKVEEIVIAIPSASGEVVREIVRICRDTNVRFKTLPGMQDLLEGKLLSLQLREISVEDLLRRPPAEINLAEIAAYITGKVVLITGAGGSIGSEICRQIIPFQPSALLLVGQGENSIYQIHQELSEIKDKGRMALFPIIGDVKDEAKINAIFAMHQPHIVFHAAAHKHVPLMELSPEEAVKNNIIGTLNLVRAAHEHQVERFVMISTDKAVNPTSVMGASKRVAEMVLKAFAKISSTRFCAVRFGNVLGSRGSVIPLFKRQIEHGGPITVTHPNMIRYFMTIPEASKLVIQAGSYGKGGEVFLLDMGEPVKIADLAMDLIRLAGLQEGRDIKIEYTGIRPGEKLYEELLTAEEGISATRNKKIFIAKPEEVDKDSLSAKLELLVEATQKCQRSRIIALLQQTVLSYIPNRDSVYNEQKHQIERVDFPVSGKSHLKVIEGIKNLS